MPYDVTILNGSTEYLLQAESVSIRTRRSPIVFAFPGADNVLIDLGQHVVDIFIEGELDESGTNLPSAGLADKDDLESIAKDGWSNTIRLIISDESYYVKIYKSRFILNAGREEFWDYTLSCVGFRSPTIAFNLLFQSFLAAFDDGTVDTTLTAFFEDVVDIDVGAVQITVTALFSDLSSWS